LKQKKIEDNVQINEKVDEEIGGLNMNLAKEFDEDESIQEILQDEERQKLPKVIVVKVDITDVSILGFIHSATGETNKISIVNGKIQLMQNRIYFVPVNTDANSDDYKNLKIPSDIADKIDIRYIKDKFACITVLQHNTIIKNEQRLCIMSL